jgi:hypothetical protein
MRVIRKVRRVHLMVSENFYNILTDKKRRWGKNMYKSLGIRGKEPSFLHYTDWLATNIKFPEVNKNGKKRRSI